MYWAISVQAGLNPGTISLFQWKGVPWSVAGATRTPHQGPWPAGPRPPYDRLFLGRDCARPASCFWGYMNVCFGVIVRTRINQHCVCVSSGVLVRSAPFDPGVCVLSPLCRSASCAGFSDGAVPRRLCAQKPLQAARRSFWTVTSLTPARTRFWSSSRMGGCGRTSQSSRHVNSWWPTAKCSGGGLMPRRRWPASLVWSLSWLRWRWVTSAAAPCIAAASRWLRPPRWARSQYVSKPSLWLTTMSAGRCFSGCVFSWAPLPAWPAASAYAPTGRWLQRSRRTRRELMAAARTFWARAPPSRRCLTTLGQQASFWSVFYRALTGGRSRRTRHLMAKIARRRCLLLACGTCR